ncbi:LysM peptidoglycan-binding domain-containing protein [Gordonia zhaorongruii]|uniref:LysM peptidoglycan-binding domain-containing protein n=1 Tax=Gordonia zhaorongruii TaxID=2597659 RepID=UPI001FD3C158|nr:LysM peptidoglycan-binding domain-containing protein [Gordonia zhaorongruii]
MSQALAPRTADRVLRGPERTQITAMTCDVPVVERRVSASRTADDRIAVCRPTGRDPRRARGSIAVRPVPAEGSARRRTARSDEAEQLRSTPPRADRSRSNIEGVIRRRRAVGALLLGGVLAGVVWVLAIVGSNYQDAATPNVPAATQVVHVRSGESLTDVARRVAPHLPEAGVVQQLRKLNGLENAGLRISQPLVAPAFG